MPSSSSSRNSKRPRKGPQEARNAFTPVQGTGGGEFCPQETRRTPWTARLGPGGTSPYARTRTYMRAHAHAHTRVAICPSTQVLGTFLRANAYDGGGDKSQTTPGIGSSCLRLRCSTCRLFRRIGAALTGIASHPPGQPVGGTATRHTTALAGIWRDVSAVCSTWSQDLTRRTCMLPLGRRATSHAHRGPPICYLLR